MAAIGILGGTFDPPHYGHLIAAECARVQFGLSSVLFMPAGDPYMKSHRDVTPVEHRLAMTKLATDDNPRFTVDSRETERAGATYTAETLEELLTEGVERPVFILGVDAVRDMPNWRQPQRINQLAKVVVAAKGHSAAEVAELAAAAGFAQPPPLLEMPDVAISSTIIRERVAAGLPVRYLLPLRVEQYIRKHGLYAAHSG